MFIDKPRSLFHAIKVWGHDMDFEPLLIPAPTKAKPGSDEKILTLRARLEAGEDLYHPDDETMAEPPELQSAMASIIRSERLKNREERKQKKIQDAWQQARDAKERKRTGNRIRQARKYARDRAAACKP
jgi:hypothetical protein